MSSATTETVVPPGTWTLDPVHSTAGFSVQHMVVGTFRGTFADFDVKLEEGTITGVVKPESIDVKDENLKGHLLTPDFFDVARHPEIRFTSTAIRDNLEVEGRLEINGVSQTVVAKGRLLGPGPDAYGNTRIGVDLETVVDRHPYGLKWNAPIPGGGFALGDDVTISVHAELIGQ